MSLESISTRCSGESDAPLPKHGSSTLPPSHGRSEEKNSCRSSPSPRARPRRRNGVLCEARKSLRSRSGLHDRAAMKPTTTVCTERVYTPGEAPRRNGPAPGSSHESVGSWTPVVRAQTSWGS